MPDQPSTNSFSLKVALPDKLQQDVSLMVHVFNTRGQLLSSGAITNGVSKLPLNEQTLLRSRIFISPSTDKLRQQPSSPSIEQLLLTRAYELPLQPNAKLSGIISIPDTIVRLWLWQKCHVTGTITTPAMNRGVLQNLPVCNVKVHICEIDFGYILHLPDFVVQNIQLQWWNVYKPKVKFPFKMPDRLLSDPVPRPDPTPVRKANLKLSELEKKNEVIAGSQRNASGLSQQVFSANRLAGRTTIEKIDFKNNFSVAIQAPPLIRLDTQTEALMSSASLTDVRQALLTNITWFKPWFCFWWYWLHPYFYVSQELAVVQTNNQGKYDADIWYQVFGDKPDVYVWAEYLINGTWTTVYRPSVPCSTRWDYVCGTPVNISISDSRLSPCIPPVVLTEAFVEVIGIGAAINTQHILQNMPGAANEGKAVVSGRVVNTIGLAKYDEYYRPLGGMLELKANFGDGLISNNATHFRWSYRLLAKSINKAGSHTATTDDSLETISTPDPNTGWTVIDGNSFINYEVSMMVNGSEQHTTRSFPLVEKVGDNDIAFRIPPKQISQLIQPKQGETLLDYTNGHNSISTWFATYADTFLNGLYELKLELFHKENNKFVRTDISTTSWKVPKMDDGLTTENAPALTFLFPGNNNTAQWFRMMIRVDNNRPYAAIDNIKIGTNTATSLCGFVQYGNTAAAAVLGFTASHPNDFAHFDFTIKKGNTDDDQPEVVNAAGLTIADGGIYEAGVIDTALPKPNDKVQHYTSKAGTFSAGTLLGKCSKAAFASVLHVYSLATNGTGYEPVSPVSVIAAFALEP